MNESKSFYTNITIDNMPSQATFKDPLKSDQKSKAELELNEPLDTTR